METLHSTLWADLTSIRTLAPVVLNITNFVAMDLSANALLAIGASPIMAHSPEELPDLVSLAQATVLNMGTLDEHWIKSMRLGAELCQEKEKAWVFDPVGCGASHYRTQFAQSLIRVNPPTVIRGNASEIISLLGGTAHTKGVDSTAPSEAAITLAKLFVSLHPSTVVISGATDYVIHAKAQWKIENGSPQMARVTAMGCTASSLIGAFLAVSPNPFKAALHAMALMSLCGELAAQTTSGTGSFRVHFLDQLSSLPLTKLKLLKASAL